MILRIFTQKCIRSEENHFGFRCLCMGYEDTPFTAQRQGLVALEMELIHAGSACAARLLAPDLDIPPLSFCKYFLREFSVSEMHYDFEHNMKYLKKKCV